jgi:hypothetical protein
MLLKISLFKTMSYRMNAPPQTCLLDGRTEMLTLSIALAEFMELYLVSHWEKFGSLLNIPAKQMNFIKEDFTGALHCMREVLDYWLKHCTNPTGALPSWEDLVDAVDCVDPVKGTMLKFSSASC